MRALVFLLMILAMPMAMAAPHGHRHDLVQVAARDLMRPPPKSLLGNDDRAPRVGNQQAAAQVRHAYANYKILSLRLMDNAKGPPIYRVKTLSPDGVVKYVYVDAVSGEVFE